MVSPTPGAAARRPGSRIEIAASLSVIIDPQHPPSPEEAATFDYVMALIDDARNGRLKTVALTSLAANATLATASPVVGSSSTSQAVEKAAQPVQTVEEVKREAYRAALRATHGNPTKAARLAGVSRKTIYRFIDEHPEARLPITGSA